MRISLLGTVALLPSFALSLAAPADFFDSALTPRANNATAAAQMLSTLPTCAVSCIVTYATNSTCGFTDVKCLCGDKDYNSHVTACVKARCTVKESLTAKNVSMNNCGLKSPSRKTLVRTFPIVGSIISTLAVIFRLIARLPRFGGKFGADDWTIILSNIGMLAIMAIGNSGHDGFGDSVWTVAFSGLTKIQMKFWFVEKIYISSIWITKISILFFYLRIFPERNFRRLTYGIITVCAVSVVALLIASIMQCQPISYSWNAWDGQHKGKCTHVNAQIWANAGINIFFDLIVLALPLPQIWGLKISWDKKAGVLVMFGLGILVTAASVIRLQSLIVFARSDNLTYEYVSVSIWSTVEMVIGILVACLPGHRAFYTQVIPRCCGRQAKPTTTSASEKPSKSASLDSSVLSYGGSMTTTIKAHDNDEVRLVDVEANRSFDSTNRF